MATQCYGVSGLYHAFQSEGYEDGYREGYSVFGTLGVGGMSNESDAVPYEREHDAHLHYGVGAELGLSDGLAVRGEVDLYDKDAKMASVSLLKRFGGQSRADRLASNDTALYVKPVLDSDADGVPNHLDHCDGTRINVKVDEYGCAIPVKPKAF